MQEKLWVVIQQDCNGIASVLAFDFESDAQNFAQEMTAAGNGTNTVVETTVNRRHEAEAAIAHVELPEFNTECIECLIDISELPEGKQDAAAKYLEEHRSELQKDAEKMVDKYIKKAVTDFFAEDRIILG
ncbi:hypothetical protein [Synergistes jonesii]|uniref:Uncharacterized protein n=1 Tax=Synergistes jonesii TaxID=2754 RepID=A0A073ITB2_9BACT|nr:hypothetical protein [Synergistes jonesii]KEJ93553.1 hypothetical protein EH55_01910 [Synergistes jonesii]OFB61389.1 hypothetical protein JS72_10535 [Synergistes jonesii]OFB65333.1 hypothetical protein JS73_00570 [Synergistes jonesii]OFB68683.1 hypothetical protein JS79_00580 [Synergistes jonesii]OFB69349.1 hypothetical protein JS78_00575 [Synergistes jonesii]